MPVKPRTLLLTIVFVGFLVEILSSPLILKKGKISQVRQNEQTFEKEITGPGQWNQNLTLIGQYGSKYYYLEQKVRTWDDASKMCQSSSLTLMGWSSGEELEFIRNITRREERLYYWTSAASSDWYANFRFTSGDTSRPYPGGVWSSHVPRLVLNSSGAIQTFTDNDLDRSTVWAVCQGRPPSL